MMKFWKKGAMFGLDARIALAVLAIVSLSIGLSQEKEAQKSKLEETEFQINVLEKVFLKHWKKVIMAGLSSNQHTDANSYAYIGSTSRTADSGAERYFYNHLSKLSDANQSLGSYNYTNSKNSNLYVNVGNASGSWASAASDFFANYTFGYHNFNKNFRDNAETWLSEEIVRSASSQFHLSLYYMREELGFKSVKTTTDKVDTYTSSDLTTSKPHYVFEDDAYGNNIKFYYIVENNINENSPLEKIMTFIIYSYGENMVLDSVLPKDLNEIDSFIPQGDDIVKIFNDKDIYTKMKIESINRLTEIKDRIKAITENNYIDRISLCTTEVTVSANCDLDSDGDFDNIDENMLLNLNPFPKLNQDSTATYLDSTNRFNNAVTTPQKDFLNYLGLPEYYSADLFGRHLRYDSNIGNKSVGPYTMEVWY